MAIISRFLASKWVTVALLAALAGTAYYIYAQGRMLGGAKERIDAYEATIQQQQAATDLLIAESKLKDKALGEQAASVQALNRATRLQQLAVIEARKHADKITRDCMALHLADGLQFGPSRQDASSKDQAGPDVDG